MWKDAAAEERQRLARYLLNTVDPTQDGRTVRTQCVRVVRTGQPLTAPTASYRPIPAGPVAQRRRLPGAPAGTGRHRGPAGDRRGVPRSAGVPGAPRATTQLDVAGRRPGVRGPSARRAVRRAPRLRASVGDMSAAPAGAEEGTCDLCGQRMLRTSSGECWHPYNVERACPPEPEDPADYGTWCAAGNRTLRPGAEHFVPAGTDPAPATQPGDDRPPPPEYSRLQAAGKAAGCVGRPYGAWCSAVPEPGTRRCARCTGVDYPELRDPAEDRRAGGASVAAILRDLP